MRISFYALGCKANQADNQTIQDAAAQFGWQIVPYGEKSDYVVVSTCAVTAGAEQRSRQMLRSAQKQGAKIIATGCFINKIDGINLYLKNTAEAIEYLKNIHAGKFGEPQKSKTRALVRIQDGCNFNCAYCIIHKIRGPSRSRPAHEIIADITEKESLGYKEIVLTGINICLYRHDNLNFAKLLKKILAETSIPRIRLGSIDPRLVTDEFIGLFENNRLLPHLHLSLQSGSDRILKMMDRSYTAKQYLKIIDCARVIDPLFSFTTDIIVGFPGEKKQDVEKSVELIKKAKFTKVHLFPFSARPGTAAHRLHDMPAETKKLFYKKLNRTARAVRDQWLECYCGKTLEILFESQKEGIWTGYAPYYFRVSFKSRADLENQIVSTKISLDNILA